MATDLTAGVALSDIPDGGMLAGEVNGEAVVLARRGSEVFAVGGTCTHYNGPLAEGVIVGDTIRCPWHHACFNMRTGEAECAPAFRNLDVWKVERHGDRVVVREKSGGQAPSPVGTGLKAAAPHVIIIGAGAAGFFCAHELRKLGHTGKITLISRDESLPFDKPNLSKDYLAGTAPEDWIPLQAREWYDENHIDLRLGVTVKSIDTKAKTVDGMKYDALVLATGATPRRLDIPGANGENVHYLRTFDDSRRLIERAKASSHVVVIGASFIGLEVAASMRARGLDVTVVAPEPRPLEVVLGAEVGDFVKALHESKGVHFRLGHTPKSIEKDAVVIDDGERIRAGFVVIGVGVVPSTELASAAGLTVDRGIVVNEFLETSAPGVYAAGDVARWPYRGESIRIEHWVVAARQGQAVARNILGKREPYRVPPFFWSAHYDAILNYVGSARPEHVEVSGSLENRDAKILYKRNGRVAAVATIFRDRDSLEAEIEMERELQNPRT